VLTFSHLLSCLGFRRAFARANLATILSVASDPMRCSWWQQAEKPWQALAACCEIAAALTVRLALAGNVLFQTGRLCMLCLLHYMSRACNYVPRRVLPAALLLAAGATAHLCTCNLLLSLTMQTPSEVSIVIVICCCRAWTLPAT
jgi:hypothetical protein